MKTEIILIPNSGSAGLGSIYRKINSRYINEEDLNTLCINVNPNINKSNVFFQAQHIYVVSDEKINFGDYVLVENKDIKKVEGYYNGYYTFDDGKMFVKFCEKIIATTHDLKNVLKIPQTFIDILIEEYNKRGNFDNVPIQVINGNISLNRNKETFTREEVIELLKEFNDEFGNLSLWGDFKSSDFPKFNKWIEENL